MGSDPTASPDPDNVTPISEGARIRAEGRGKQAQSRMEAMFSQFSSLLTGPEVGTFLMGILPVVLDSLRARDAQEVAAKNWEREQQVQDFALQLVDRLERLAITSTALSASGKEDGAVILRETSKALGAVLAGLAVGPGPAA